MNNLSVAWGRSPRHALGAVQDGRDMYAVRMGAHQGRHDGLRAVGARKRPPEGGPV